MTVLTMAMTPARAGDVCDQQTRTRLEDLFEVRWASDTLGPDELASLARGSDVLVTSWGTPHLAAGLFDGDDAPSVIAHAAGSIKWLVDGSVLDGSAANRHVTAFSAGTRIAWSVGEYCLAATMTLLRRLPEFDQNTRAGLWQPAGLRGRELRGRRVGIVGASSTARAFIELLRPFQCNIAVYDPYLSLAKARQLGVTLASLGEVTQADIVSIHVPDVPATEGMITAKLIAAMRDNTVVINSSRGLAVDNKALERELARGRLQAALDVYPTEPPRMSKAMLGADNVLLTPHIAGDTLEGHASLVGYVLTDVLQWLEHGTLGAGYVNPATLAFSA
ncbi:NAD(P)-dependent oxidoreductase [Arthrobacter sp. HLT1-20]